MKRYLQSVRGLLCLVFVLPLFHSQAVHSQSVLFGDSKFEVGIHLGPSNFLGDVGGNQGVGTTFLKDLNIPFTRFTAGAFFTIYPREWIGIRLAATVGSLAGHDSIIQDKGGAERDRKIRNLGFRSPLLEAYTAIEIYPTVLFERWDGLGRKFRPYGLAGVGIFRFNPKAKYTDGATGQSRWVDLKPLRLEGQGMSEYPNRKEYNLTQINIPVGVGFKYYISEKVFVGMEVLHRFTFTDYIDDVSTTYVDPNLFNKYLSAEDARVARSMMFREPLVTGNSRPFINSQRGDPKDNDSYLSAALKLGVRLNGYDSPNGNARRQMRCPAVW